MEQDRYAQNHGLYVVSIISLVIAIGFIIFSLYLFPFLVLNWIYSIPNFIINIRDWLQLLYGWSTTQASWAIFNALLSIGLIAGWIAYWSANRIENKMYGINIVIPENTERDKQAFNEGAGVLARMIGIVILVICAYVLVQWLIYIPPVES